MNLVKVEFVHITLPPNAGERILVVWQLEKSNIMINNRL